MVYAYVFRDLNQPRPQDITSNYETYPSLHHALQRKPNLPQPQDTPISVQSLLIMWSTPSMNHIGGDPREK